MKKVVFYRMIVPTEGDIVTAWFLNIVLMSNTPREGEALIIDMETGKGVFIHGPILHDLHNDVIRANVGPVETPEDEQDAISDGFKKFEGTGKELEAYINKYFDCLLDKKA